MINLISSWRHVFKLDPDREISDDDLERVCMSGTDAIIVGGSSGVTYENMVELLSRVRRFSLPCVAEISSPESVTPGYDLYLIPIVLNAGQADWITGLHHYAIKRHGAMLPWDMIVPEAYVILNPDSTAAKVTQARTALDQKDIAAYAQMSEHMFRSPILYIEYSGAFGDMKMVKRAASVLHTTQLFYGGGIDSLEKAEMAAACADTIIVGNIIYENIDKALETVLIKRKKGYDGS